VIILKAGQLIEQDVVLDAPAQLTGTVTGSDGTPRLNWTVVLYQATQYPTVVYRSTTTRNVSTNDQSIAGFTFTDIAAGNYIIEIHPTASGAPVPIPLAKSNITITPSEQLDVGNIPANPNG
jgi:hypothetical protein